MSKPCATASGRGLAVRLFSFCSVFLLGSWVLAQPAPECPPGAGVDAHPMTESFFDITFLSDPDNPIRGIPAKGPTTVRRGDPVQGTVQTEIVSMELSGDVAGVGPFVVRLAEGVRSVGEYSAFTVQDGICVAQEGFFDVLFEIEIKLPQGPLVLTNNTPFGPAPLRLGHQEPVPIPHVKEFTLVQIPNAQQQLQIPLYDKNNPGGPIPVAIVENVKHTLPPPPCPCFPPAGRDVMQTRLGHFLDIPGIGKFAPLMIGPTVVNRGDPYYNAETDECCIDTEIVSMNLTGSDPILGSVEITLNPDKPSTGTICGPVDICWPALSCFEIYILVTITRPDGTVLTFVNCDPIIMCCTITSIPPYGCSYAIQNPPINLYKWSATFDVCANPPPIPAARILEASHTPGKPPVCPPPPGEHTTDSTAVIVVDVPKLGGPLTVELQGHTTVQRGPADATGTIQTEIVSMTLTGATPFGTIELRESPNVETPSRGVSTDCRKGNNGELVLDSFFDVFVEITLPNPENPSETLVLINPVPVIMGGKDIPVDHNSPSTFTQLEPGVPLIDAAGNTWGTIEQTTHDLPPPPPPRCDCFPRAGIDKFISRLLHVIDIPGVADVPIQANCSGPVVVKRGDPYLDPVTGLCMIDTEIVEMMLRCSDPHVGQVIITLNKKRQSKGYVRAKQPDVCFPSESCFEVYIRVELPDLGIVLVNCAPILMCCDNVMSLPPYGCPYMIRVGPEAAQLYREIDDPANPLASVCDLDELPEPVAKIVEARHTPQEPEPEPCACFPPAGRDVMQSNLWHEIIIPGLPPCRAHLTGQVVVDRGNPYVDPLTGKCCIDLKMASMLLQGIDPACGPITIELNPNQASTGRICEIVEGTCLPGNSFFDIYIKVTTDAGVFYNCFPAHMEAVIHSIPPYNAFYNLKFEGLGLWKTEDVCGSPDIPPPDATIGKALHVPVERCECFGPGKDIMDSELGHKIRVNGLGLCEGKLSGRVEVERYDPYVQNPTDPPDQWICCQRTEITFLELSGVDPVCEDIKVRLNPDRPSTGFICQKLPGPDNCFQAQSCFEVFVIVEIKGKLYENCEPTIMCCQISQIPPYRCLYVLRFGEIPLYAKNPDGTSICDFPTTQRPPPDALILADSQHVPKPCRPIEAKCEVRADRHAYITVIPDPNCPCEVYQVTRGDTGIVLPPTTEPLVFRDPDPCTGPQSYTVVCIHAGTASDPVSVNCPCPCIFVSHECTWDATRGGVHFKWTTAPDNCCFRIRIVDENNQQIADVPSDQSEVFVENHCPPGTVQTFCIQCIAPDGSVIAEECCEVKCPPACEEWKVTNVQCKVDHPDVTITWDLDPLCPCDRVVIKKDGAVIATVNAADKVYVDKNACPPAGSKDIRYCVICVDADGNELSPEGDDVCCTARCVCVVPDLLEVNCQLVEPVGAAPYIRITWKWDPNCPICDQVTITRDGVVIGTPAGNAPEFRDPCVEAGEGLHTYCVECPDPTGVGPPIKECCEIACPGCNCPPAGIDKFRSELIHLIEVPGLGTINAGLKGYMVVSRGDPYIDPTTGLCCINTKIEKMVLTGSDPLVGYVRITLNPCKPSTGTICQKTPGPDCFPAENCFDIYIRVELPDLGMVLVNCDPIEMCCDINSIPPYECQYGIRNDPIKLYKELPFNPDDPCRSVCDLNDPDRPDPVAFINEATHIPKEPSPNCDCYPQEGDDVMDSNLWHEIDIPGIGVCMAGLSGQVVVHRENPIIDNGDAGLCSIKTQITSMELSGEDEVCGKVTIRLNPDKASVGEIKEQESGTCFQADSFFDVFVEVEVETPGGTTETFVNCEPAHMEAVIDSIPPWNSFYNLRIQGLELFRKDPAAPQVDPCVDPGQPAGSIGEALHVPRQICDCFGEGVDVMQSELIHNIRFIGLPNLQDCTSPFQGLMKVVRGKPYLDADGFCTVDTEIVEMTLVSSDPNCGTIRLNPNMISGGYIRQLQKESCFDAISCFQVYIQVEIQGQTLVNCEPAIMCCRISAIPPYKCVYELKFGGDVKLYKPEDCDGLATSALPPPVAIIEEIRHIPDEPCQPTVACQVINGQVHIYVQDNENCPCDIYRVTREDGTVIPLSGVAADEFIDPDPCVDEEVRTYTVECTDQNSTMDPVTISCTCSTVTVNWRPCDADGNSVLDLTDAIRYLNWSFVGLPDHLVPHCKEALDCDANGALDLTDAIVSLNYQFTTGVEPASFPFECKLYHVEMPSETNPNPDPCDSSILTGEGCP